MNSNSEIGKKLLGKEQLDKIIQDMRSTINSAVEVSDNNNFLFLLINTAKNLKENIENGIKEQEEIKQKKEKGENKKADVDLKKINIQALNFIYSFREFITQEQMYFAFTSNKTQETTYVSTKTLFQQQYVNIENGFFQFQNNVYTLTNELNLEQTQQKSTKVSLQEFKKKIIQLGTIKNTYSRGDWKSEVIESSPPEKLDDHTVYRKAEADLNVYVAFISTKNMQKRKAPPQRAYYYNKLRSKYYNRGWLNEWSTSYYNNVGVQKISNFENLYSIKFLIDRYSRDSNKGSIIGDLQVQKNEKRIQIQEKTTVNKHIISLKQARDTLNKIIELLIDLQNLSKEKVLPHLQTNDKNSWQSIVEKLYYSTNETYKEAINVLFRGTNILEGVKIDNLQKI